ncbi:unnamed protein product [Rhizophagus irregularis]|nr:unnamed protein product [Rhizophagus irregularis]
MYQQTNYKLKTVSSDVPLNHPTQTTLKPIYKKCNGCKRKRKVFDETDQICHQCYKAKKLPLSGNKVIDDFIRFTLTNYCKKEGGMEFVPYEKFRSIEFIAEGGFSKVYKAAWINGPINNWNEKKQKYDYYVEITVVLKELNNSENINSKELNELKIYYDFVSKWKPDGYNKCGKLDYFSELRNQTNIIKSPDIGPITNNPNAVYKSRPLSAMIKSAESTRSLKIQGYKPFNEGKRMINDNSIEDTGNSDKIIKKIKLNKNDDYLSKELEFDIDNNINIRKYNKFNNSDYTTREIGFDI